MTYILSIFFIALNSFCSLLKKQRKVISSVFILFIWTLFWKTDKIPDYGNYLSQYNYTGMTQKALPGTEFGYSLLMKLANYFGLNYRQFVMIISALGLFLIINTIKKYTTKPQLVYALYFIYPLVIDIVQIRNFFAMSIVIFSVRYLVSKDRKSDVKYIICILIAFSMHYVAILYLPMVILKHFRTKTISYSVIIVILIGFLIIYNNLLYNTIILFIPEGKVIGYFSHKARFGFLIEYFIQIIQIAAVYYSAVYLEKKECFTDFSIMVKKINIYTISFFPLYTIDVTFGRIYRNILILNYILYSLVLIKLKKDSKIKFLLALILYVIVLFLYYIFIPLRYTVVYPLFNN